MAREPHREDVRILFLEDNPLDVELVRLQLERDGLHFESRVAASEAGLRAALREFEPDVVLCDYSMPGYSGREAVQLNNIPAVLVLITRSSVTPHSAARSQPMYCHSS